MIEKEVKYSNQLNLIPLLKFTSIDIDLLMLICCEVRDKKDELIILRFSDMRRKLGLTRKSDEEFNKHLQSVSNKLKNISGSYSDDLSFEEFNLFSTFFGTAKDVNHKSFGKVEKGTFRVRVNPDYAYLLNELADNYTTFELKEFVSLTSKHAKNLYRLLKQWRRTGIYEVYDIDKLKAVMDCPITFQNKYFIRDYLNVAIKELNEKECFKDLRIEIIRDESKRGKPIVSLRFLFTKEEAEKKKVETKIPSEDEKPKRQTKPKKKTYKMTPREEATQPDYYNAIEKQGMKNVIDSLSDQ